MVNEPFHISIFLACKFLFLWRREGGRGSSINTCSLNLQGDLQDINHCNIRLTTRGRKTYAEKKKVPKKEEFTSKENENAEELSIKLLQVPYRMPLTERQMHQYILIGNTKALRVSASKTLSAYTVILLQNVASFLDAN